MHATTRSPLSNEPYICLKRALHSLQKSPIFCTKEPYIFLMGALQSNRIPHNTALHIFHLCRPTKEPYMFLKRALYSSQKWCLFHSKEPYTYSTSVGQALEPYILHKRALYSASKSPIFCTKEPYTYSTSVGQALEPYILHKRALHSSQKRCLFHTKEPSIHSTSAGQALELRLLTQFCIKEPYILLKRALHSSQKRCLFHIKEPSIHSTSAVQALELRLLTWTPAQLVNYKDSPNFAQKSPTFCSSEPSALQGYRLWGLLWAECRALLWKEPYILHILLILLIRALSPTGL